jgi:hypothetical protein
MIDILLELQLFLLVIILLLVMHVAVIAGTLNLQIAVFIPE